METQEHCLGKNVSDDVAAGAAVYSNLLLAVYDILVFRFELPFVFKCTLSTTLDHFQKNVTNNHMDVGVGTGFFLDKCKFPTENPTIHLMDLNHNTLEKTSKRIKRYNPVSHHCNVLAPIQKDLPMFDSISVMNFFHCLPGNMLSKEAAIKNLKPFLNEGGMFFGITVLGEGVNVGFLYKRINSAYNKQAVFSNLNDNPSDLKVILQNNFENVSVITDGAYALFSGQQP